MPLGGEIASRLAYTQKSEGQNLPGRPTFALRATARRAIASWHNQECAVSDTGGGSAQAPWSKTGRGSQFRLQCDTKKNKHLIAGTIDTNGSPVFPYYIGRAYYGSPTGGSVTSISETVTTNFQGGPGLVPSLNPPVVSNTTVTLVWSATEGGTYRVESSTNLEAWTTNATNIAAVLNAGTYADVSSSRQRFYTVARTITRTVLLAERRIYHQLSAQMEPPVWLPAHSHLPRNWKDDPTGNRKPQQIQWFEFGRIQSIYLHFTCTGTQVVDYP